MTSTYVELRARSAFSFLRGASNPEDLVDEAARLEHGVVALGDRNGLYGAPRFFQAAKRAGIRAIVGADLALADGVVTGGSSLYVLVESRAGYRNLCRLLTQAKLRAAKGEARVEWSDLEPHAEGLLVLAGGDEGPFARAAAARDESAAREIVARLRSIFADRVYIDLQRHLDAGEERRNRFLAALAEAHRIPLLVTNDVRHATRERQRLLDVLTCIREKTSLDRAGRLLAANGERHLKPAREIERLFRDVPDAVRRTTAVAERCTFTLADLGYRFPDYPLPAGVSPDARLRELAFQGARRRYRPMTDKVRRQLDHELAIIRKLELAGYFLIVWDLVEFCRREGILAQGRGSAANSAVCFCLGITAVDAVGMDLLFERFLSEERGEWPDIDIDLPSGDQRERVIQYVYDRYGRLGAGMTANVITYRSRSAAREIGSALGFAEGEIDKLSKCLRSYGYVDEFDRLAPQVRRAGLDPGAPRVRWLVELAAEIEGLPRHLGQHSGGMVISAGRLDEVVPLEPARMPGRVVVEWDKDDCADLGIIKVDLLGLGMMAVLEEAIPLVREHEGKDLELATIPADDPLVYAALRRADTVGVFQVESRAQMATLPRMKPERFYDLVVEVAIIRPGPIVGQMVHPYLSRRAGKQPVTYLHPSLEPILERTLGVPLFQEQLLRMAMAVANFTPGEAEELRRALGFKRSAQRMGGIEKKLRAGMTANGITGETQETLVKSITSFALYGFPECIVGETRVIDADNGRWLTIEDAANGKVSLQATLACGDDLQLHRRRVRRVITSGQKMVYRLRTALGREISATAEHPFFTLEGWRKLGELEAGDRVGVAPTSPPWGEVAAKRRVRGRRRDDLPLTLALSPRGEGTRIGWDHVTTIEPVGVRATYDLEIEGDHNFLANDFVVHNSHSASFALLAYASAYLKVHHGAAFLCAMLNQWPMGFYHPATLVKDAQRHGVRVLPVDATRSGWLCALERDQKDALSVRLGFRYVHGLREDAGRRIESERRAAPFASLADFARRTRLRSNEVDQLAHLGAFAPFGYTRREALWQVAALERDPESLLARVEPGKREGTVLPEMTAIERTLADYGASGMTVGPHVMRHLRERLRARGVRSAVELRRVPNGEWVRIAGHVIVRQRPGTAKGLLFLTLEDETGVSNAIVMPDRFEEHRAVIHGSPLLLVEGKLQNVDGVIHVRGERFEAIPVAGSTPASHDFH